MNENDIEVDVFIFQRRYTTQQWANICKSIKKRHSKDDWFYKKLNWDGTAIIYLRAEGIEWIDLVYYREEKNYLNAEITFSINRILKFDKTKLEELNQNYVDMNIKGLMEYFQLSEKRIRNAIGILNISTVLLDDNDFRTVKAVDVMKLEQTIFKKKYWERLEEVRLCLKKEKYIP